MDGTKVGLTAKSDEQRALEKQMTTKGVGAAAPEAVSGARFALEAALARVGLVRSTPVRF